ncbi:hypothetical protein CYMTET_32170 [Cymbomonas tetramitiformis]|uniref:Uncharacterized protein n=1 Tax=Cymbomonas tetramitiformis TaxID=36881 RepID=A0AAE0KS46_9CHLO|nr:hypothetical protein CYMTET_32170 [Cymbomonas tetramitiformis]
MPQMYNLHNDKTYDALSKRTNSSMRYEHLVLAPTLSYLHDADAHSEATMDWMEDTSTPPTYEELVERIYTCHNTTKGVLALLGHRYTMTQLRASMESDVTVVHAHGLGMHPVGRAETELLRACAYVVFAFVTFGRPDTSVSMLRELISVSGGVISVVLHGEKGRRHARLKRRLTIPTTGVQGLVQLPQRWVRARKALWVEEQSTECSAERCSYWRLPWERGKLRSAQANGWVQLVLGKLGCAPPEGGHFSGHSTRKGAYTCARAVGTALEKCCILGGWSQLSSAIHSFIDPTAVPDEHMENTSGGPLRGGGSSGLALGSVPHDLCYMAMRCEGVDLAEAWCAEVSRGAEGARHETLSHHLSIQDILAEGDDLSSPGIEHGAWTQEQSGASPEQVMPLAGEGVANLIGASTRVAQLFEGAAGAEGTGREDVDDERGGSEGVVGRVDTRRAPQSPGAHPGNADHLQQVARQHTASHQLPRPRGEVAGRAGTNSEPLSGREQSGGAERRLGGGEMARAARQAEAKRHQGHGISAQAVQLQRRLGGPVRLRGPRSLLSSGNSG